jgi:two-component system cell cycle sensor histidine kinase/response regulator CckA
VAPLNPSPARLREPPPAPLRFAAITAVATIGCIALTVGLVAAQVLPEGIGRLSIEMLGGFAAAIAAFAAFAGLRIGVIARRDSPAAAALHQLPAAYLVATPEGEVAYANAAASALFPAGEAPITILRERVGGEAQRDLLARLEAGALTGRAAHGLINVVLNPGQPTQLLDITVTPMPGRPRRALWRIENVSERERQRAVLEADYARLLDVFDEAPFGLYSIERSGRFLMLNRTLADWLGSTPETLLRDGARLQDFLLPSQQQSSRPAFDPLAPADGLEIILQGRQGRLVRAAVSQTVVREAAGFRTRSVLRDLASERTWEDALRLVRQRFQRFFEIAPVGIALVDATGRFTETNRALEELLTDGTAKLQGRDIFEFVSAAAAEAVRGRLDAAWAGEAMARPLELRLEGSREKNAALFVSRLESDDGGLSGLILHFIDLTEQKSLEAQFAQSQKMQAVGQLAGGVAHDFNNLLTAMIGFCDLLLLRFKPGDQSFADINQIKQNANRAANLVRQLLAFSRQQPLQPKVLDLGDVLGELSHLLNRLLGDNVELKMVRSRISPVKADQGQFEQVIINLAVNARDAMPNGGTLTIRTAMFESREPPSRKLDTLPPQGVYVLIEVGDTGTGIPREIIGRIFEPFFSTKEVGTGTGLGLSTVYGIIKQTGGYVFVESTVGSGTKFSIYLPQHVESAAVAEARRDSSEPGEPALSRDLTGAGTVLLVEDEDPVRMFSARALRNKGYSVLEAKSGEAALGILAELAEPVDLIITDVVMPRMDGPALIRQVREKLPDVKVIFISGYTEDTFRKRLGNEDDIHFLAKPFTLQDLAGRVKEVLAHVAA